MLKSADDEISQSMTEFSNIIKIIQIKRQL